LRNSNTHIKKASFLSCWWINLVIVPVPNLSRERRDFIARREEEGITDRKITERVLCQAQMDSDERV